MSSKVGEEVIPEHSMIMRLEGLCLLSYIKEEIERKVKRQLTSGQLSFYLSLYNNLFLYAFATASALEWTSSLR